MITCIIQHNSFHHQSALTLTEVLKEREAQVELKQLKAAAARDQDAEYLKIDQMMHDRSIQADQAKARARMEAANRTADFQISQSVYRDINWDVILHTKHTHKDIHNFICHESELGYNFTNIPINNNIILLLPNNIIAILTLYQ